MSVRLKVLTPVMRTPEGQDPNDFSEEALRKRNLAPGSVFDGTDAEAEKLIRNKAAEITTDPVSSPEKLEMFRKKYEEYQRECEKQRIARIREGKE